LDGITSLAFKTAIDCGGNKALKRSLLRVKSADGKGK